ncbi:MAG: hypothetical protein M5U01_06530 [Ardenticatenaceae bacterium]|nr:hypothetical protein [Ardenticatenaceae bacterium]HBY97863.1 hypothetical protein [Chloroflexota bacterium]
MLPSFAPDGNLPPGIHSISWAAFAQHFGSNLHRQKLLKGLLAAARALRAAGCQTLYVDGSFVTTKSFPNDFDACWDIVGVDPTLLDPVFLDFKHGRRAQKAKFYGELFVAQGLEGKSGLIFLDFFQIDKSTGARKGIVALELRSLP